MSERKRKRGPYKKEKDSVFSQVTVDLAGRHKAKTYESHTSTGGCSSKSTSLDSGSFCCDEKTGTDSLLNKGEDCDQYSLPGEPISPIESPDISSEEDKASSTSKVPERVDPSFLFKTPNECIEENETMDESEWNETPIFNEDEMFADLVFEYEETEPPELGEKCASASDLLYEGASITVGAVMLLLALYTTRYGVSVDALQYLLSIIHMCLPSDNKFCRNIYDYKKFFTSLKQPVKYHYYCSFCFQSVESENTAMCTNKFCLQSLREKDSKSYFIEISIMQQLQTFFKRPGFCDDLGWRFDRKVATDTVEDIYDGTLYKSFVENDGILSSRNNLSFTFNTDGVPVFKSSNVSIWPVYLVINELPYKKRMSREYSILAGLWFGESKPVMGTFLKPFHESLFELENGVTFQKEDGTDIFSKCILLCGTFDLPARSLICNNMQYNGKYSCIKCLQEGETAQSGRGRSHIYPFIPKDPKGPMRTKHDTVNDAKEATQKQLDGEKCFTVNGMKGTTWLMLLRYFDCVHGIGIDYMHGVLQGVQKSLLKLWFDTGHSREDFSYFDKIDIVDKRLSEICPPSDIGRLPRSVSNHLKYWKASELRSFLLFFGIPVLSNVLAPNHFNHYALLVQAVYLLLQAQIPKKDIDLAEHLLTKFCEDWDTLYPKRLKTLNFHQLLHLSDGVRQLGPLYTHSCFFFEELNGYLLSQINGSQNITSQITSAISFYQKLPELKTTLLKGESISVYNALRMGQRPVRKDPISNCDNVFLLGRSFNSSCSKQKSEIISAIQAYMCCALTVANFKTFKRIEIIKGEESIFVYGLEYTRMTKRNNSCVMFRSPNGSLGFGLVSFFIQVKQGEIYNLAICHPLHVIFERSCHIYRSQIASESDYIAVPVAAICEQCVYMEVSAEKKLAFIARYPNRIECD